MKIKSETIKRVLAVALCFSLLMSGAPLFGADFSSVFSPEAKAADVQITEDGFKYKVIADTIHITGYEGSGGDIEIPGTIEGKPVLVISESAFYGDKKITAITLNENLQFIGNDAFAWCTAIESVSIPDTLLTIGELAFDHCTKLNNVAIGENSKLEIIKKNAFGYCENLESIYIPDSVKKIESEAFWCCENLTTVTGFNNVEVLDRSVFSYTKIYEGTDFGTWFNDNTAPGEIYIGGCLIGVRNCGAEYVVKEGTKVIVDNAFNNKAKINLTKIVLPESLKNISDQAFNGCESLESINIPANVETIGISAFKDCKALKNVVFATGSRIKSVGLGAFRNCTSLETVEFPDGIESIGSYALEGTKVTEITLPDSLSFVGDLICDSLTKIIFSGDVTVALSDSKVTNPENIDVIINDGAKRICAGAFLSFNNYKSIKIPDSIEIIEINGVNDKIINSIAKEDNYGNKYIGKCLVEANPDLEGTVNIKSDTISVKSYAFVNCTKITKLTGFDNVIYIGVGAFRNCTALEEIDNLGSVKYIGSNAFDECRVLNEIGILDNIEYIEYDMSPMYGAEAGFRETQLMDDEGYVGGTCLVAAKKDDAVYTIREGTRVIAPKAFGATEDRTTNVIIPDSVVCIGESAFSSCDLIETIRIPGSVKYIGGLAFGYCDLLKTIIIDEGVEKIDGEIFDRSYNLEQVHIPASLTEMGYHSLSKDTETDTNIIKNYLVCFDSQNTYAEQVAIENAVPFIYCDGNHEIEDEPEVPDTPDVPDTPETILLETNNKDVAVEFGGNLFGCEMWLDVSENVPDDVKSSFDISSKGTPLATYMICLKEKDAQGNKTDNRASIPDGESVTVKIKNPQPNATRFYIIHMDMDGNQESYTSSMIRIEGDYLVLDVYHFSYFAVFTEEPVEKTVSSVSISTAPYKTSYTYKQGGIDLSGIELTVTYTDGSTETVTDTSKMTISGFDNTKIGKQTVTVEYEGQTANFEVTVSYAWWQWIIRILLLGFFWY